MRVRQTVVPILVYLLGASPTGSTTPDDYALASSVSSMFDATQSTWIQLFASNGKRYVNAELILYRDAVESGCGHSRPAMGSFYCPVDRKVYIDLGVYLALRERFAASADLGQAYIIAHEIAHHAQTLLRLPSTHSELQADCLAGVSWHSTTAHGADERGDIEKAVSAAVAIGAHESPEVLTHGPPAQRVNSFWSGFESGQISACSLR